MEPNNTTPTPENEPSSQDAALEAQSEAEASHLEREDDRWRVGAQLRDWGVLAVLVIIYLVWTQIIYLFEPGIR